MAAQPFDGPGTRVACSRTNRGFACRLTVATAILVTVAGGLREQAVTKRNVIRKWEADPHATFVRRLGISPTELGGTDGKTGCPDIWELSNGDVAVIGRDLTWHYTGRLPHGVTVVGDERLVVIPRATILAAKKDIPDA
jgi:hypothetical protein